MSDELTSGSGTGGNGYFCPFCNCYHLSRECHNPAREIIGAEINSLRAELAQERQLSEAFLDKVAYRDTECQELRLQLAAMTADRDSEKHLADEYHRRLELAEAVFTALGKFRSVKAIGLKRDLEALDNALNAWRKATQP
jgi:uncharacterized coiled-coil DUF342 family protein